MNGNEDLYDTVRDITLKTLGRDLTAPLIYVY